MKIVYFTSKTKNTEKFANKLPFESIKIINGLIINEPFVLFVPTYANANGSGSVATPIKSFLNEKINRENMVAVVGFGNRSFGKNFAIGSEVVSLKCKVPLLYKVELSGNEEDIEKVTDRINKYE